MSSLVLAAHEVRKAYGKGTSRFEALKGVSLGVAAGESVAIVGKSGSGKSTLMHVLALLDRPDSGTVSVRGNEATRLRKKQVNRIRNEDFGFVFQQFFLMPNASVLENVVLPLKIAGVGARERHRRGMEVLKQLALVDKAKTKAVKLSGGQKQRVAIARALANNPRVIFADEPTGNLDSATGGLVEDILFGLNQEQGITLVIVTHDPQLAARCDRQVVIRDGELSERGPNDDASLGSRVAVLPADEGVETVAAVAEDVVPAPAAAAAHEQAEPIIAAPEVPAAHAPEIPPATEVPLASDVSPVQQAPVVPLDSPEAVPTPPTPPAPLPEPVQQVPAAAHIAPAPVVPPPAAPDHPPAVVSPQVPSVPVPVTQAPVSPVLPAVPTSPTVPAVESSVLPVAPAVQPTPVAPPTPVVPAASPAASLAPAAPIAPAVPVSPAAPVLPVAPAVAVPLTTPQAPTVPPGPVNPVTAPTPVAPEEIGSPVVPSLPATSPAAPTPSRAAVRQAASDAAEAADSSATRAELRSRTRSRR